MWAPRTVGSSSHQGRRALAAAFAALGSPPCLECRPRATPTSGRRGPSPRPRCGRSRPRPRRPAAAASVTAALEAVRRGEADHALVPIENSVEGSVSATLDELAVGDPLMVTREVLLPVSFALMVRPGTGLHARTPGSDPPARAAQCRRWLRDGAAGRRRRAGAVDRGRRGRAGRRQRRPRRRDRRADRGRALPARGAGPRRRGQRRRRHAVRARQPAGRAAAADRARQDVARGVHLRRPPGRAARGADRARGPRRQPDPDRVAPDRRAAGPLLLLDRLRGSRRRRPGRRGAVRAAPGLPGRAVPRLLPAGRPRRGRRGAARDAADKDAIYRDAAAWLGRIRTGG